MLQDRVSLGETNLDVLIDIPETQRSNQEMSESQANQFGIDFTQDASCAQACQMLETRLGFPQLENQFNLKYNHFNQYFPSVWTRFPVRKK